MDSYKLLSRSTRLSRPSSRHTHSTPSSGQNAQPQLLSSHDYESDRAASRKRKRKRSADASSVSAEVDFFGAPSSGSTRPANSQRKPAAKDTESEADSVQHDVDDDQAITHVARSMTIDDTKNVLHKHKLKITWLNPPAPQIRDRGRDKDKKAKRDKAEKASLYPQPLQSFSELRTRYTISARLAANLENQGFSSPTEVQMGALPLLLENPASTFISHAPSEAQVLASGIDLLTVAPTGSGKTLAFMIPLLRSIGDERRTNHKKAASAIILAPTKELSGQIVNEGRKLSKETGIKVSQVRKGMKFSNNAADDESRGSKHTLVKSDILVSTPGVLATALQDVNGIEGSALADVRHLILDEADVLLDPLFREQTMAIWNSLPNINLRVSLWSATMGSNIEELARLTIETRISRISKDYERTKAAAPFIRLVVGLKDSAVPNVKHKLVYAASEQGKLMGLRQLIHPSTTSTDSGPPLIPPFLVFTQTIERAVALHSELLYDIPAEAGGISRVAVLHSDLSDSTRDSVMTRFRKGDIWVLITTDLLSRGVDFRGVNGVVNYDIPTSSAAYVHRVGRTGRAGREGGVAVTLYSKEDISFLKPIANLIVTAQKLRGTSDAEGVQSWLLKSLPSLSKQARQGLRKHGVESRTTRGKELNPKAARKARISTKAGYVRREENKRKGAIQGSRHRHDAEPIDDAEETDFGGLG